MVISYCVLLEAYFVPYKGLQGKAGGAAPTLDEQRYRKGKGRATAARPIEPSQSSKYGSLCVFLYIYAPLYSSSRLAAVGVTFAWIPRSVHLSSRALLAALITIFPPRLLDLELQLYTRRRQLWIGKPVPRGLS